jgi:hypothetical protein
MAKLTHAQRVQKHLDAEAARERLAIRRRQVRRYVAMRMRWVRIAIADMPEEERGRRLHANEIAQRSLLADVWRATDDAVRWQGEGKHRRAVHKDADRWQAVLAVQREAQRLTEEHTAARLARRGYIVATSTPQAATPPRAIQAEIPYSHNRMFSILDQILQESTMTNPSPGRRRFSPGEIAGTQPKTQGQAPPPPPYRQPGRPQALEGLDMTVQSALAVIIPFGKFRGDPLEDLIEDDDGLSYLWWLANEADIQSPRFAEAVEVIHDLYEDDCIEARERFWRNR